MDKPSYPPSWRWLLASAAVCGIATLAGVMVQRAGGGAGGLAIALYGLAYLAGGWEAFLDVLGKLKSLRLDIHFLMLAVALGAASIGAWWEGAALLFLFSLSNALEEMAMARTDREIRELFLDAPETTLELLADGSTREIPVATLAAGTCIRVLPGEQFPADGEITHGESAADESTLTGESIPVGKGVGDPVFSGTMNTWGKVDVRVGKPPADSAHARILRLIVEAQASKAPSQRFTDRFGTGYTIGLLGLTLVMFLVWHYGFGIPAFDRTGGIPPAFYRAMTLLVVCSPCALVISIPSAILTGVAAGARRGILFRGGVALENLATMDRLAVDKTGTLTSGVLQLVGIEAVAGGDEDELLAVAAALARHSTHPLSRAIAAAHGPDKRHPTCTHFQSLSGKGLAGRVDGRETLLGRREWFAADSKFHGLPAPEPGVTEVLVESGSLAGRFLLRDTARPEAATTVRWLQDRGITVTMLTGDREESAALVARELGLRDWRSGLHPEDKVGAIRAWQEAGECVAMAGDGVNDAPGLALADISIGMGLRGSDATLEQADVVLTHDRIERIPEALLLSSRCRTIIRQNLVLSLAVVVVLGFSALASFIPLPMGVLGHEGSTVIVVINSLRLLRRGKLG